MQELQLNTVYNTVGGKVNVKTTNYLNSGIQDYSYALQIAKITGEDISDIFNEDSFEFQNGHRIVSGLTGDLKLPTGERHNKSGKLLGGNLPKGFTKEFFDSLNIKMID